MHATWMLPMMSTAMATIMPDENPSKHLRRRERS